MSGRFINGQFHESNPNTQNDEHTPRVIVMRHAHGVTLNPVSDTLLDAEGNDLIFDNEVAARAFLSEAGFSNEDMEFLYFVELDNTISGKGLPVIEGTTEDTGFKGSDYCDEYCSHCEQITYVYRNEYYSDGKRTYLFTMDLTEEATPFDVRDLRTYRSGMKINDALKRSIETGELTTPE